MKKGNRKILLGLLGIFLLLVGMYVYHMNTLREEVLGLGGLFKKKNDPSSEAGQGAGKDWVTEANEELSLRRETLAKLAQSLSTDPKLTNKTELIKAVGELRTFMAPDQTYPNDNAKLEKIVEQFNTILGTEGELRGRPETREVAESLSILKQDGLTINDAVRKIRGAVDNDQALKAEVSPLLDSARALGEQLVKIGSYNPKELADAIYVSRGNYTGLSQKEYNLALDNVTQERGMIEGLKECLDIVNTEPGIKFIDDEGVGSEYRAEVKNADLKTMISEANTSFNQKTSLVGDAARGPVDEAGKPGDNVNEPWEGKGGWDGTDIYIDPLEVRAI